MKWGEMRGDGEEETSVARFKYVIDLAFPLSCCFTAGYLAIPRAFLNKLWHRRMITNQTFPGRSRREAYKIVNRHSAVSNRVGKYLITKSGIALDSLPFLSPPPPPAGVRGSRGAYSPPTASTTLRVSLFRFSIYRTYADIVIKGKSNAIVREGAYELSHYDISQSA